MLNKNIKKYLDNVEKEGIKLHLHHGEHKIAEAVKKIIDKEGSDYTPSDEDLCERIAFDFLAEYPNDKSGWGTYYGPMFVLPNKQKQMVEYPSMHSVSETTLNYWGERAEESENPILSSRYADLVVDFSLKILNKNANYKLFHLVIDSNIQICDKSLADPLECKTKIKRALGLAIQVNNKERVEKAKEAIIKLEKNIAEDDKAGLWGFAFKWLLLDFYKKVSILKKEKESLVKDLEERLERIKEDPWPTEHAVSLLAEFYSKENDEINLVRVLSILEDSVINNKRNDSSALLKINAYEQIHQIYQKYSNFEQASEAAKRISKQMSNLDLDWDKTLKTISVTKTIKNKEIDKFLKAIFGGDDKESLEKTLARIVVHFLPKKDEIKNQFDNLSKNYPLQFLFTTQVISSDGITVAKLSSLDEDYEKHYHRYASQHLQFGAIFLGFTIDELKRRVTKDKIFEYLRESDLFKMENEEYLKRALSSYWENDYLIASHLFIPLIENTIRELIRIRGGIILVSNDVSGYDKLPLTTLLYGQGDMVKDVFTQVNHDVDFYFRLVLIDKIGMNLRNNFAHGLEKKTFFSREASDRLFHILLCLSLVKIMQENEPPASSNQDKELIKS